MQPQFHKKRAFGATYPVSLLLAWQQAPPSTPTNLPRKHTGERPFQCHCSRRFSRLDNLRQHAQTVHVNEDIPIGSLAATGTRFQRQIRTDRVRAPAAGRARSSTAGSLIGPSRGHSKSFSTSNIGTITSIGPSMYSPRDDLPRRPPPLATADPRSRQVLESGLYHAAVDGYRPVTPTNYATPTSATFSNGPGSPRWTGNVISPSPSHSRPHSMYATGSRTPVRRLSVPSAEGNFYHSPTAATNGRALYPLNASNSALFSSPERGGVAMSPESPGVSSNWSRRESISSTDEAWRRRTWHPGSREFNGGRGGAPPSSASASNVGQPPSGSSLGHFQTGPDPPLPIANPATQQSNMRLPGIDTFLNMRIRRPVTPPLRGPSPMAIDSDRHVTSGAPAAIQRSTMEHSADGHRAPPSHWETPLNRGLDRLDLEARTPPRDSAGAWASDAERAVQAQAEQSLRNQHQPSVRFETDTRGPPTHFADASTDAPYVRGHQHTMSAPAFNGLTPRQLKRQAWYNGPSSSPNGGRDHHTGSRVDRMVHPNLADGFSGFPARGVPQTVHEHQTQQQSTFRQEPSAYASQDRDREGEQSDPLSRLDALVAVATSEVQASAKAY